MVRKIIGTSSSIHEDMLEAFQNKLAELDVDACTDIQANIYEQLPNVTVEDLVKTLAKHGYSVNLDDKEKSEYLSSAALLACQYGETIDDCCETWFEDTFINYPEDIEWLSED